MEPSYWCWLVLFGNIVACKLFVKEHPSSSWGTKENLLVFYGDIVRHKFFEVDVSTCDSMTPDEPIYIFGSAMLAHTCQGLCDATQKTKIALKGYIHVVSYEFLQLWSWEYLPIGRPHIINPIHTYNHKQEVHGPLTFGSRWIHASKRWSNNMVHGYYPEYHQ